MHSLASNEAWGETDPREARRWLNPATVALVPAALAEAEARLAPATMAHAKRFLGPAFALVAPVSMTADQRDEWIVAALAALTGIPPDLFDQGCQKARQTVRFPSEIVPTIFEEVGALWTRRKRDLDNVKRLALAAKLDVSPMDRDPNVTPGELQAALRNAGFGEIADKLAGVGKVRREPPRAPTVEETEQLMKQMVVVRQSTPMCARSTGEYLPKRPKCELDRSR